MARRFRAEAIWREAPSCSGVYGLSNAQEWIYVGETDNIQERLLDHLGNRGPFQDGGRATGFSFEECPAEERVERQRRLIAELEPVGNGEGTGGGERMRRRT